MGSSSFFLIIALVYLDNNFATLDFRDGGVLEAASKKDFIILLVCFVFGFSKTAIFPFYQWLPRAMVAPIPVSALLHAVAVVKSGVFSLIKVFVFLFGYPLLERIQVYSANYLNWLIILSCFTIIFAGVRACFQDSLKKILAYSTISQLSYMVLVLSFASKSATIAAFTALIAHAIVKITLFFIAGVIYISTHKVYLVDLKGIYRKFPVLCSIFTIAVASIIGLPGTIGYISNDKIFAAIKCDNLIGSIATSVLIISKLLACFYFAKIIFTMLKTQDEEIIIHDEAKALKLITILSFCLLSMAFYFLTHPHF
jgi:multicomponent Na+:H+ antiporter subunit D